VEKVIGVDPIVIGMAIVVYVTMRTRKSLPSQLRLVRKVEKVMVVLGLVVGNTIIVGVHMRTVKSLPSQLSLMKVRMRVICANTAFTHIAFQPYVSTTIAVFTTRKRNQVIKQVLVRKAGKVILVHPIVIIRAIVVYVTTRTVKSLPSHHTNSIPYQMRKNHQFKSWFLLDWTCSRLVKS